MLGNHSESESTSDTMTSQFLQAVPRGQVTQDVDHNRSHRYTDSHKQWQFSRPAMSHDLGTPRGVLVPCQAFDKSHIYIYIFSLLNLRRQVRI